jgi:predicted alpha-1,2-mannosidase
MKKSIFLFLSMAIILVSCKDNKKDISLTQYVNPMVGTAFNGHTYPGALLPFGMIQVSPDTHTEDWQGCSGYHYDDSLIRGFSHTHLSGTGCSDYGDVLLMPFVGKASVINNEYESSFTHANETAKPGYYSVLLDKNKVKAELTATQRVGMHRYIFPNGSESKGIIIDLQHRDKVLVSNMAFDAATNSVSGIRNSSAWNENQQLAFSLMFSQPIQKIDFFVNDTLLNGVTSIAGTNCKALVYFAENVKDVVIKAAISANTKEPLAAMKNMVEVPDFDFDRVRKNADSVWNHELSKIIVKSKNKEYLKVFYTALYHTLTGPYLYTDIDGTYLGQDGELHKADDGRSVYTVFSLWDTYRAAHPLLNIIDQKRTQDFLYTFMKHYEQGGMLTVWELSAWETWCMIGYHSVPVIYDAYMKGLLMGDPNKILEAMIYSAKLPKFGRTEYDQYGYIPGNMEHEDVSKTLEYAYDDWCIAQFAKAIGNEDVYKEFIERCQFYKNILDPNGFMHSKINGAFIEPFHPEEINSHYTEGNCWQYSTYVPHDFETYIHLIGGDEVVSDFLDSLFYTSVKTSGRKQVDVTGLIGQYAHGNEPSHHAAYLYNYVGKAYKTQEIVRHIINNLYSSKPDGLCGNEDCGQMSAWYVFSAMGFYPVCPGSNQYIIGSPVFDEININLENGNQFTIKAKNQKSDNKYIKSAKLNGKDYTKSYITYDDIKNGGILEFVMDSKPNKEWATSKENRPTSKVESSMTIVPISSRSAEFFSGEIEIALKSYIPSKTEQGILYPAQADVIYFTTDGSIPTIASAKYENPIKISKDTEINFVAWNEETGYSKVAHAKYFYYTIDKQINLLSKYSSQYPADGNESLIDGKRGSKSYSLGGWQGYEGQDVEAVVDLGSEKNIKEVSMGFLQDVGPWILFPSELQVEISNDNVHFTPYGTYKNTHSYRDYEVILQDFTVKKAAKTRYIKLKAKNFGNLPEWHLGAGGRSWIFTDEITVK